MLRATAGKAPKTNRIAELIHRAVPYPVLLLLQTDQRLELSLAHKRWAQNEAGKVMLDGDVVAASLSDATPSAEAQLVFTHSLALARQPQTTLFGLYQAWVDSVQVLLAANKTGTYKAAASPEQAAARRQALADCERLEAEISRQRAQAAKEKQLARQVDLNLTLKRVQAELAVARQQL